MATIISASKVFPGGIPGYTLAKQVTVCVRDASGRDVSFLELGPITI